MLIQAKAFSENTFDAVSLYCKPNMLLGYYQAKASMGRIIGTGEEEQFRCRNFQAGSIKDVFEISGIEQP